MTDLAAARAGDAPGVLPSISKRHVTAAVIGNALEFYDFTTYAYFAVQIGHAFFPRHSEFIGLMLSLATFGAGFILRPVGAVVIGRFADRVGRRPAMLLSLFLMGVSILGLALTPSYAMIGTLAPVLAVGFRLAQGFALGGEVGPTTAYLIEAAPPLKRGLYGAWQGASQSLAAIAGGLVGVGVAAIAGSAGLETWGWRVAFLLGALVLPFGFLLRRTLPETLHHAETPAHYHPDTPHLSRHAGVLIQGLGLIAASTVATYVLSYMTTYAITALRMPPAATIAAPIANGAAAVVGGLLGGALSDRVGRRVLLIWPRLALIVIIVPAFTLMVRNRDLDTLLGATAAMSFLNALTTSSVLTGLTESLRKEVRGVAMGVVYATAVAVFGGTTQPIIAWITHATGNPISPGWYLIAASLVGVAAALAFKETVKTRSIMTWAPRR